MYVPAEPILKLHTFYQNPSRERAAILTGFPSDRCVFFSTGRGAFWGSLKALGLKPGQPVLLPAYICRSILGPLKRLHLQPEFYRIDTLLQPDLEDLESQLRRGVAAVLLVHYFGFPSPAITVRNLCSHYGSFLVEDCAHALFSRDGVAPLGGVGDVSFFSLRKCLPVPDGGLLVLNEPGLDPPATSSSPSTLSLLLRCAYLGLNTLETASGVSLRLLLLQWQWLRNLMVERDATSDGRLDMAMSMLSRRLTWHISAEEVVNRRRANFIFLLENLQKAPGLSLLYSALPEGVCPFGFPLLVESRTKVRIRLLRQGINVRVYWEHLPPGVDGRTFAEAQFLSDHMLVLPVHPGVKPKHLAAIVSAFEGL